MCPIINDVTVNPLFEVKPSFLSGKWWFSLCNYYVMVII